MKVETNIIAIIASPKYICMSKPSHLITLLSLSVTLTDNFQYQSQFVNVDNIIQ